AWQDDIEQQLPGGAELREERLRSPAHERAAAGQWLGAAHVIGVETAAVAQLLIQGRGASAEVELEPQGARGPGRRDVGTAAGDLTAVVVEHPHDPARFEGEVVLPLEGRVRAEAQARTLADERPV